MPTPIVSPETPQLKRCSKCGKAFPATAEYFYRRHDGLRQDCKPCAREYNREYRTKNADRLREYHREYRVSHAEERREYYVTRAEQRLEKRASYAEYYREYYVAHAEERRAYTREYRAANVEERREYDRQYRQTDKGREVSRAHEHRRRARKLSAGGTFTAADIEAIRVAQGNRCYLCHKKLKTYHIDHFIPLALGGTNAPGNLRLACPKCNQSKGARHPHNLGILI